MDFSIGAISKAKAKAKAKATTTLSNPHRQIGEYVRQQPAAHTDETRHFRAIECRWLWALVTLQACYLLTQVSGCKEAADTLLGDFSGYLVTNDYVGYARFSEDRRQLCWPHLIRKLTDIGSRIGNGGIIGRLLLLISHAIIRIRHRWQENRIKELIYYQRMNRLRRSFRKHWNADPGYGSMVEPIVNVFISTQENRCVGFS